MPHPAVRLLGMAVVMAMLTSCGGSGDSAPSGEARKDTESAAMPAVPAGRGAIPPRQIAPSGPTTPPEERPGMVFIPAGEFVMGRDDPRADRLPPAKTPEHPWHIVHVDAFYMDKFEVTNTQYEKFKPHERHERSTCDDCPVVKVTWFDARDYCAAQGKRLPTEAEWEKAAKGGINEEPQPLMEYAWIAQNSGNQGHPVGSKRPNGYGLHDMLGNVREWTADWYDAGYYRLGITRNPKGPAEGVRRVERGGAFFLPGIGTTTTVRYNHPPHFRLYFLGFRCVQDP